MKIMIKKNLLKTVIASTVVLSMLIAAGCGTKTGTPSTTGTPTAQKAAESAKKLSGEIKIDGSSTVFPITQAVVETFNQTNKDVKIPVGVAGTGGGMKKFVSGEIDIADASRKISDSEKETAKKNGIEYVEFQIAYDGISVVVNKSNTWIDKITTADLKKIWEPNSSIKKWSDLNSSYPNAEIKLYGPGMDSGTMEYFTEEINKKKMDIRKDYTPSEDDNVLVQGITGDKNAMGFFGYAYYFENKDKLKVLSIDAGTGAVTPDFKTIKDGTYKPLGRPLFIYVNSKSLEKDHVKEFVKYYISDGTKLIQDVGYVPMDDYSKELAKIK